MKLQKYYEQTLKYFKTFADDEDNCERLVRHISAVKAERDYENLEVRIACDLLRVFYSARFICDEFYAKEGANDSHITTLAVKCFRDANLGVLL